jgi:hypothetical protein
MENPQVESFADEAKAVFLPPPPDPLLRFAVRGWADAHGVESPPDHAAPSLRIWLPAFIRLLANPDWLDECRHYAIRGAYLYGGENCDLLACVSRAFKRPDTAFRIIHEIARRLEAGWP